MRRNHLLTTVLTIAFLTLKLLGQADSGTVVGTVTDPAGAVVANATVTITNEGTGLTRTAATNGSGQYRAAAFPTGRVSIMVEQAGFQKLVRSGLTLTTADTLTVNLELRVGNVQDTVEVTEAAPLAIANLSRLHTDHESTDSRNATERPHLHAIASAKG
jgi:hypothetical protein